MNQVPFREMNINPQIMRAIEALGFEHATEIQSQAVPLIQGGGDVIGRSQTGTGKTLAFGIPAIEKLEDNEDRNHAQVLILCPTRELAMQACEEIKKLAQFLPYVRTADIYGGAAMDRQIMKLRRANIVIGTPGRVMDHMRRKTLKLEHLKMIVLDEADEMLSMGFREDIETILQDTPQERQTILFSATMPPDIMALTRTYQKEPQIVEIDKKQVTVDNITQVFFDVPMGRKMDALNLMMRFYNPQLALIFCNTKAMVDSITEYLTKQGFEAEGLHGDMKQTQRSKVMDSFKYGKTSIMVATDVAARGIDVNDIDYVINYDIPQNTEYYIHRIGRTGRAGKEGTAITICSGRRQVDQLMMTGRMVKSKIARCELPDAVSIRAKTDELRMNLVQRFVAETPELSYSAMIEALSERGLPPETVAAALMELHFGKREVEIREIKAVKPRGLGVEGDVGYSKIRLSIGRSSRVAPNHIVGAITERTSLSGREIGKIEIFDDNCLVGVPTGAVEDTVKAMSGSKICGQPIHAALYEGRDRAPYRHDAPRGRAPSRDFHKGREAARREGPRHDAQPYGDVPDYRVLPKKKRFHKD